VRGSLSQPVGQRLSCASARANSLWAARRCDSSKQRSCSISKELLGPGVSAARVGEKGTIKAGGGLGLTRFTAQLQSWLWEIKPGPHPVVPRLEADIDGELGSAEPGQALAGRRAAGQAREASMSAWWPGPQRCQCMVERWRSSSWWREVGTSTALWCCFGPSETRPAWRCGRRFQFLLCAPETTCGSAFGPDLLVGLLLTRWHLQDGGMLTLNGPIDRTLSASVVRLLSGED